MFFFFFLFHSFRLYMSILHSDSNTRLICWKMLVKILLSFKTRLYFFRTYSLPGVEKVCEAPIFFRQPYNIHNILLSSVSLSLTMLTLELSNDSGLHIPLTIFFSPPFPVRAYTPLLNWRLLSLCLRVHLQKKKEEKKPTWVISIK